MATIYLSKSPLTSAISTASTYATAMYNSSGSGGADYATTVGGRITWDTPVTGSQAKKTQFTQLISNAETFADQVRRPSLFNVPADYYTENSFTNFVTKTSGSVAVSSAAVDDIASFYSQFCPSNSHYSCNTQCSPQYSCNTNFSCDGGRPVYSCNCNQGYSCNCNQGYSCDVNGC